MTMLCATSPAPALDVRFTVAAVDALALVLRDPGVPEPLHFFLTTSITTDGVCLLTHHPFMFVPHAEPALAVRRSATTGCAQARCLALVSDIDRRKAKNDNEMESLDKDIDAIKEKIGMFYVK